MKTVKDRQVPAAAVFRLTAVVFLLQFGIKYRDFQEETGIKRMLSALVLMMIAGSMAFGPRDFIPWY
jgi:hypothetical protein